MNRVLGYFTGFTSKFYLAVIVALILALPLAYCKGRADGKAIEAAKWERAAAKAQERARKADAVAGEERAGDLVTIKQAQETRDADIRKDPANPYRALACRQLRQAGKHAAAAKAGCGGGDGSEADSAR